MTRPRLLVLYAGAFVALTAALTFGFALGESDHVPMRMRGVLLTLLIPGGILRPNAWLFHHWQFAPVVTAALAAGFWIAILLLAHLFWSACVSAARRVGAALP